MNTAQLGVEKRLMEKVDSDKLWANAAQLAQWVRHSGTAEEREAFAYVKDVLDSYDVRTTMLEHPALISYPLHAELAILDNQSHPIHTYRCLGTAHSASVDALEAEVVDIDFGTPDDFARVDVSGKVVLVNGLATPAAVFAAERAGAVGQIFINDDHLHYMIVTTIWGTPTPESAGRLPTTPSVSVVEGDGHELRNRVAHGSVRVRVTNHVFRDWQTTPILVGDLDGRNPDEFVLCSGHLDSWEVGAMDNGSANATMLEVARILAESRKDLHRGVRFCFWSGHSHGRYSGSTWYADHHWEELYEKCVAHVNFESTGASGATSHTHFLANLELAGLGEDVIRQWTGQQACGYRMSRAGDMSFNGIGIPALFMGVSQVPMHESDTDYVSVALGKLFGSKMPWWWHTSEDTIDKLDPAQLVLDTQIYLGAVWRLCGLSLLQTDFRRVANDIQSTLADLQAEVGDNLDLSVAISRAESLTVGVAALAQRCATVKREDVDTIASLNGKIKKLSRLLIPLTYTEAGQFDHDPAWNLLHLPSLAAAPRLTSLAKNSDEYHFLRTRLERNRNRVCFDLRQAVELLAGDPMGANDG